MKNLAKHIELLLRDNDCVILPGFGGFIAHTVPAYYVSEEHLYYPPSRSISFNTAITMNDGLLAQSYMKSYNVDYAQATYLVDVAIEQLRDALDEEGSVTIPHIGIIKQDIHQKVQFAAEKAGLSSPQHFGLGTFVMHTLAQIEAQARGEEQKKGAIITQTEKTINLRIQKRALRQVLSTAAVFLLLLMAAMPVGDLKPTDIASLQLTSFVANSENEDVNDDQTFITEAEAELTIDNLQLTIDNSENITEAIAETETVAETEAVVETEVIAETEIVAEAEAENENVDVNVDQASITKPNSEIISQESEIIAVADTKTYHIIVASLPSRRGAEEVIEDYVAKGYPQASLVERDNRVRISLAHFADKDEANSYLKTLRENEVFQNAWLLPVRN